MLELSTEGLINRDERVHNYLEDQLWLKYIPTLKKGMTMMYLTY